jgi:hypothetical protein
MIGSLGWTEGRSHERESALAGQSLAAETWRQLTGLRQSK